MLDLIGIATLIVVVMGMLTTQERYEEYRQEMPRRQAFWQAVRDDFVPAIGSLVLFAVLILALQVSLNHQ